MIRFVPLVFLVSACSLHTDIQSRYTGQRDQCRELATIKQQVFLQNKEASDVSGTSKDAQLLTHFSNCMGERGWTVASPNPRQPGGTPPIDLDARRAPTTQAAPAGQTNDTVKGRKVPIENNTNVPQNTPLSANPSAPLYIQKPTPSPSAVARPTPTQAAPAGSVSRSRAGVPVYETKPAMGDPTRTMEEEWLRGNNRR